VLTACVCGASPGAPPAHAGAPPAARRGRRAAARPPTRAWPAGGASGQADRGGWGRRFGWGGARPRQAPARALRSPGGALPWCCGCVRARARVLALSKLSTGEYDKLRRFSDRIRGDRRQTFPSPPVAGILHPGVQSAARSSRALWHQFGVGVIGVATGEYAAWTLCTPSSSERGHALRSSTVTSARHLVFRNASSL
jgi:hypothetical protein